MNTTRRHRAFLTALFATMFLGAALAGSLSEAQAQETTSKSKHHKHKHGHLRRHAHAIYVRPQPASYIVDADSGKVLESENPDAPRYPASLTKMMTLYLTFDALKHGTMSLNQTIPVSEHAACQPQTNIALQPGERIAVKDAVLSIVIRSANDSAVALGEAMGGSESGFAEKMTAKARSLGMKHTVFRNASGLPDPGQHTTAHDMAILGMALRRNFPQYFPVFKTESFSYHGLTYVTHNHVMTRYDGVDGIKTGYIRASGFNLVTSVARDGRHLVAVVMGGPTSRARDDKMIALLDQTFTQLASSTAPGDLRRQQLASLSRRSVSAYPAAGNDEALEGEGGGDLPGDDVKPSSQAGLLSQAKEWGIQVGAFAHASEATNAASQAMQQAPSQLVGSKIAVSDDGDGANVHRARLVNLTQAKAEGACQILSNLHEPCFVYKTN